MYVCFHKSPVPVEQPLTESLLNLFFLKRSEPVERTFKLQKRFYFFYVYFFVLLELIFVQVSVGSRPQELGS